MPVYHVGSGKGLLLLLGGARGGRHLLAGALARLLLLLLLLFLLNVLKQFGSLSSIMFPMQNNLIFDKFCTLIRSELTTKVFMLK